MSKRLQAFKGVTSDRLSFTMFSALTPTQFAELFPKAYRDSNPDISGFMKALPTSLTAAQQTARENQLAQTASGMSGADFDSRGYVKQYKDNMQKIKSAHVGGGYVKPPPQLTPEQQRAFEYLRAGDNPVNSGVMQHTFGNLTDSQLAEIGISKRKDDKGNMVFHYEAPTMTDEQAVSRLKSYTAGTQGLSGTAAVQKQVYDAYRTAGFSDNQARALTAEVGRENGYRENIIFGMHSDPYNHATNLGMVSMQGSRHTGLLNFLQSKGLVQDGKLVRGQETLVAMAQYQKHEMETDSSYARTKKEFLNNPNINPEAAAEVLGNDYIKWRYNDPAYARHHEYRRQYLSQINSTLGQMKPNADGTYTPNQIQDMKELYYKETNQARQQKLAEFLQSQGVSVSAGAGADLSNLPSTTGRSGGAHFGKSEQCVALSQHFSGLGSSGNWSFKSGMDGIVPGAVIATTNYGGAGHDTGKMASSFADHKSRYHTGIVLTKPDSQGNVLIYDQYKGPKGTPGVHKVNVMNYNGTGVPMAAVVGGEPSEKSKEAINLAISQTDGATRATIIAAQENKAVAPSQIASVSTPPPVTDDVTGKQNKTQEGKVEQINLKVGENVQPVDKAKVTVDGKPVEQPTPGVGPSTMSNAPQAPGTERINMKAGENVQPEAAAQVTVTKKEAPAPAPNKFKVNSAGLIAAIKNTDEFKNTFGSSFATDSMILNGFANDERVRSAGVSYNPETGTLTMKDPNNPLVKQVMSGMDTKSFMSPIEEKKKAEKEKSAAATPSPAAPPPAPTPPKTPAAPTATPNPPAPSHPGQGKTGASGTPGGGGGKGKDGEPGKSDAETAKPVPTASKGGDFNVGSQDLIAKPIGSLNGDNVIVGSKEGNPMFTMKSTEDLTVKDGVASVRPKSKESNVGPLPPREPMIDMSASAADNNPGLKVKPSVGAPDQVSAQYSPNDLANQIAEASKPIARNETAYRAFARVNFTDTGSPIGGHYTYGDQNLS